MSEQNANEQAIRVLQKKIAIGVAIFVVMLLGLAIYYVPQYWAIRSAKIAAEQRLIDPTSHLFRDIEYHSAIIREDKRGFVCGYVNGKNRMGAYTGFTGFIYSVDNKDIFYEPNDEDDDYANKMFFRSWQVACLGDDYTKHFIDLENLDKNVDKVGKKIEDLIQQYKNNELTQAEFSEQSEPLREELNGLIDSKSKELLTPKIFVKSK
ncbi:hypothetical protein ADP71_31830 [Vitreoscilla sp. C1]|uniref:hypothetical protein n=1 Tax=Vitreoscilla sp. (strain C1) TaxID=96942 RepID=UPI000CDC6225|nr:hypothetical protein [Vitreoscilla sp. C1]AUZ06361.1 hypothetical protein ADP71_31830 [Vitreoscilla sp. C1]